MQSVVEHNDCGASLHLPTRVPVLHSRSRLTPFEVGQNTERAPSSGRPRKTEASIDRTITREVQLKCC